MRLDKLVSKLLPLSRAQAKKAISSGEVLLNGQKARPENEVQANDLVSYQGKILNTCLERHYMLNKPQGYLTAARDKKQQTVLDLLPPEAISLGCMPVGRLDKDTEGLLLFTTDGQLAHRLLAPKRMIVKVYEAVVKNGVLPESISRFEQGGIFGDLEALPAKLKVLEDVDAAATNLEPGKYTRVLVELHEGQYRQVRRMLAACGNEVVYLKRLSFGPLNLDSHLPLGQYRPLSKEELNSLRKAVSID